jgi:hypothetical protein
MGIYVVYELESGGHVRYTVCARIRCNFSYSLGSICASRHYMPPDGNIKIWSNLHYTHM